QGRRRGEPGGGRRAGPDQRDQCARRRRGPGRRRRRRAGGEGGRLRRLRRGLHRPIRRGQRRLRLLRGGVRRGRQARPLRRGHGRTAARFPGRGRDRGGSQAGCLTVSVLPPGDVPIRPASSVMLVRDAALGLEVFTLQRVTQMAFAAGMTVFPGGGVDPLDADDAIPWAGPGAAWWAERLRLDAAVARGQVAAAVRELYEETGVLLAGPDGAVDSEYDAARAAVAAHQVSLAALLRERG